MDIREIDGLWCDDITFCPAICGWKDCPRNKQNIRDKTIPHSFSVEIPQDCPKNCADGERHKVYNDALAMLKVQEEVEPQTQPSAKGYWFTCGSCGWWLFEVRDTVHFDDRKRIRFCASCGKPVKWE